MTVSNLTKMVESSPDRVENAKFSKDCLKNEQFSFLTLDIHTVHEELLPTIHV